MIRGLLGSLILCLPLLPAPAPATSAFPGSNYCSVPPIPNARFKSNVLLLLDNSASMWDLAYADKGGNHCSRTKTQSCSADADCPSSESCIVNDPYTGHCSTTKTASCFTNADCPSSESCNPGGNFCVKGNGQITNQLCLTTADCSSGLTCNPRPPYYCYDDSYSDKSSYLGYFDQNTFYTYDFVGGRFRAGGSLPPSPCGSSACAASTSYLFVEMADAVPPATARTLKSFLARGNFLNWLTASKLDIEKQALTGGKYDGSQGVLAGETRGCNGKKMVKVAAEAPKITFAVGGPIPPAPGPVPPSQAPLCSLLGASACTSVFEYLPGSGGATRIEIYDGRYNKDPCTAAVRDWQSGNLSTSVSPPGLRQDARNCLGGLLSSGINRSTGGTMPVINDRQIFVDIMSTCYAGYESVSVLSECGNDVNYLRNGSPTSIPRTAGDAVCGAGYTHITSNGNTSGFLGNDYNSVTGTVNASSKEAQDFCADLTKQLLTDPSVTALKGSSTNVPSFIPDLGVYNLGAPVATPTGASYLAANVAVGSSPSGLIQEFGNDLNFGIMIFNTNGAYTECKTETTAKNGGMANTDIPCLRHCQNGATDSGRECYVNSDCSDLSGYSCQSVTLLDGGKVIAPIGSALGDHAPFTGMVATIDQITATTWSPLAEAFFDAMGYFSNRSDLRLQTSDFDITTPWLSCQKNNVIILSDGVSTADRNGAVNSLVTNGRQKLVAAGMCSAMPPPGTCNGSPVASICNGMTTASTDASPPFKGSYNLDDLAWIAKNTNIHDPTFSSPIVNNNDYITTSVVYTGAPCGDCKGDGICAATCAVFNDDGSCQTANPGYCTEGICMTTDEGVPEKLMQLTAAYGGGTFVKARGVSELQKALRATFRSVAAASGTDPSIFSTGEGNGALLLKEQYLPSKSFDDSHPLTHWIGEMQSLWYYIDPFLGSAAGQGSAIREDSDGNGMLTLKNDKIVGFSYDSGSGKTVAYLTADANGDGIGEGTPAQVDLDQVAYLWQAGELLRRRDLTTSPRTIYTPVLGGGTAVGCSGMMTFSSSSAAALTPYLNLQAGDPDPGRLISFIHGFEPTDTSLRGRTVARNGIPVSASDPQMKGAGVWKLGDIISSTPQVQSQLPLGNYHLLFPAGYGDLSYQSYIGSQDYHKRGGMVYVGANDGMLHAFNLGSLDATSSGDLKGTLHRPPNGSAAGSEQWAFIAKNSLPYLKYLAHPYYWHLYYVDGKPTLVDASIGNTSSCTGPYWNCVKPVSVVTGPLDSTGRQKLDPVNNPWRSVLIGGMGLGGASCATGSACVAPPVADPADGNRWLGYSSYFALEVTDQNNPILLWEFNNPGLGYTTTGPAIIRVGDAKTNGRWFAVFGSGPTGPVDRVSHRFLGQSSQELKFFVVDLRTGELVATIPTGILNAFAGVMGGAGIDVDKDYQDDALYVGFSQLGATGTWSGGVLRVVTQKSIDPAQWQVSRVIDGIGPVMGGIGRLQDRTNKKELWLYFGTGRYFFTLDDMSDRRAFYGVKEPCYNILKDGEIITANVLNQQCTNTVDPGALVDQTTTVHPVAASDPGWRIDLDTAHDGLGAERVLSTPTATRSGAVLFPTFQPNYDACLFGSSYLWEVRYATGGPINDPTQAIPDLNLRGKALVQLSNGGVQELDLNLPAGRRRSDGATGLPEGLKIVTNSGLKPLKKIIHIQER